MTQLATALVYSAQPCRGRLGSHAHSLSPLCYESSAVVKVTSSLDWGGEILTFKRCLFKYWHQAETCMCSQQTACVFEGASFLCTKKSLSSENCMLSSQKGRIKRCCNTELDFTFYAPIAMNLILDVINSSKIFYIQLDEENQHTGYR